MKEQSDDLESEWKFVPPASDDDIVSCFRDALPSGWLLVRWPSWTALDIYFDTDLGTLHADGGSFRFRKRQKNRGWTANFKDVPAAGVPYHARREIITRITVEEALAIDPWRVPGLAATTAREYVERKTSAPLRPQIHLVAQRWGYTMRPGDINDRHSNVLSVYLDETTAIDIRGKPIDSLIVSGFLDYTRPVRSAVFRCGEIEADGGMTGDSELAIELLERMAETLRGRAIADEPTNKYQLGARSLGLWSDGPE